MPDDLEIRSILAAAAAAVVYPTDLPAELDAGSGSAEEPPPKFVVHPHIEEVDPGDAVVLGYLTAIYNGKPAEETAYPVAQAFRGLTQVDKVTGSTVALAEALAKSMAHKHANRGIVFGCLYELSDGTRAHGLLKVDLSPEQRFYFEAGEAGTWSLERVKDILPPPRQDVAKYLIAPQPQGDGVAGIRDETSGDDSAAEYLLEAVELQAPRRRKTRARLAREAHKAGVDFDEVHRRMQTVEGDRATEEVFAEQFPEVSEEIIARTVAPESARPMPEVRGDDHYQRVYKSPGRMRLQVGPDVDVEVAGRRIVVTLPPEAEPVSRDFL